MIKEENKRINITLGKKDIKIMECLCAHYNISKSTLVKLCLIRFVTDLDKKNNIEE